MGLAIKLGLGLLGFVALAFAGLVVFLATAGDDFYRKRVEAELTKSIDREVRIGGRFSLAVSLEPGLVVTDVTVANAPWAKGSALAHLDRAEVEIALLPLLSGVVHLRRLVLDGLTLDLETAKDGRRNWEVWTPKQAKRDAGGDAFYPLIEHISAKDLSLSYRDDRNGWSSQVVLDELTKAQSGADGGFDIKGHGRINEGRFDISGKFGSLETALKAARPYPLDLTLALPELLVRLEGTAANLPHAEGFDLTLGASSPSLGKLLQVWSLDPVADGRLDLTTRLAGNLEALAVRDLKADLVDGTGEKLHVAGSLDNLVRGTGLNLVLDGRLGSGAQLLQALPGALRELDGLVLTGKLTGGYDRLVLDDLKAELTHPTGAGLTLTGHLALDPGGGGPALRDLAVAARLSLPDRALLERLAGTKLPGLKSLVATGGLGLAGGELELKSLKASLVGYGGLELDGQGPIGKLAPEGLAVAFDPRLELRASAKTSKPLLDLIDGDLPDISPLRASGRLLRADGRYRIEDLQLSLGTENQLWFNLAGVLDRLALEGGGVPTFKGKVDFTWPTIKPLADYLGTELPELGAAKGQMTLSGWTQSLAISEARIETETSDGLTARASGKIGSVQLDPDFAADGLDLAVDSLAVTTGAVAKLIGRRLPELGAVRAAGQLTGGSKDLALSGITASAGPENAPLLQAKGEVKNLIDGSGMTFDGAFGVPAAQLLASLGIAAAKVPGTLEGEFRLSDADGSLGLETLGARIVDNQLLSLSLKGKFDDLEALDDLNLQANLDVPKPQDLGSVFGLEGPDFAPLSFEGNVAGSDESFKMEGKTTIGTTVLNGKMEGGFAGSRPKLQARLAVPVFHFSDFGLAPGDDPPATTTATAATATETKPQPGASKLLFGNRPLPFDLLREFDLTLDVQLDELQGASLEIDSATSRVVLSDGLLTVDPLQFHLVGSSMNMKLVADARPAAPKVRYSATVDDLDVGNLLGQLHTTSPVDGTLDMVVDVTAEGSSPERLASSLNGTIDLALHRGKIRSRALAFTALDLRSWLFAKSTLQGYSNLHCFILRLKVDEGLAKTETLFLESDDVRVIGKGDINLANETLNLHMKPHPKARRIAEITTPFTITGTLADPTVNVSAGGTAMRTVGDIVLTPINLLGDLLHLVDNKGKDKDNPCLRP